MFYQIFPDRFANGNPNRVINQPKKNSFIYATEEDEPFYIKNKENEIVRWDFFGGNFKGIQDKIPYLQELGITALYLNPIFEASSNHRYDTNDYFKVDSILGTEEEFRSLIAALHTAGIAVVLDGVFSHVGKNSRYFNISGFYGENTGQLVIHKVHIVIGSRLIIILMIISLGGVWQICRKLEKKIQAFKNSFMAI
ncbi:alpha-amylase family glycosyl hydrolase [Enterococcus avium]